jgi:hypothetical protein
VGVVPPPRRRLQKSSGADPCPGQVCVRCSPRIRRGADEGAAAAARTKKTPSRGITRGHKRGEKNEMCCNCAPRAFASRVDLSNKRSGSGPPLRRLGAQAPLSFTLLPLDLTLSFTVLLLHLFYNPLGARQLNSLGVKKRTPARFWRPSVRNEASKRRNGYSFTSWESPTQGDPLPRTGFQLGEASSCFTRPRYPTLP